MPSGVVSAGPAAAAISAAFLSQADKSDRAAALVAALAEVDLSGVLVEAPAAGDSGQLVEVTAATSPAAIASDVLAVNVWGSDVWCAQLPSGIDALSTPGLCPAGSMRESTVPAPVTTSDVDIVVETTTTIDQNTPPVSATPGEQPSDPLFQGPFVAATVAAWAPGTSDLFPIGLHSQVEVEVTTPVAIEVQMVDSAGVPVFTAVFEGGTSKLTVSPDIPAGAYALSAQAAIGWSATVIEHRALVSTGSWETARFSGVGSFSTPPRAIPAPPHGSFVASMPIALRFVGTDGTVFDAVIDDSGAWRVEAPEAAYDEAGNPVPGSGWAPQEWSLQVGTDGYFEVVFLP